MKNIRNFCLKILRFLVVNLSVYLNMHVFCNEICSNDDKLLGPVMIINEDHDQTDLC